MYWILPILTKKKKDRWKERRDDDGFLLYNVKWRNETDFLQFSSVIDTLR